MGGLPTIRVQERSGYELGVAVGSAFAAVIRSRAARDPLLASALRPFSQQAEGARLLHYLSAANRARYPAFWAELQGVADGSGMPFSDLLLLNLRKEISPFLPGRSPAPEQHCSDVMFRNEDGAGGLIAHNEDADESLEGHVYIVHASLPCGASFLAYTYAGELPTCAFGFNCRGLAFTANSVPPAPDEVQPSAVARNFLCRDLLEAAGLDDALARIRSVALSSGHNYNLMDVRRRRIVTVEAASRGRWSAEEVGREPFFHANMYLHLPGVRQIANESSEQRQKRAAELPMGTEEDALRLLGDATHPQFPIYMDGSHLRTLHTVVFDLGTQTMTIFERNPSLRRILLQMSMQL